MAKPYRPSIDWTADPDLPNRFKVWKKQIQDEVRLLMADDPDKRKHMLAHMSQFVLVNRGKTSFEKPIWTKKERTTPKC